MGLSKWFMAKIIKQNIMSEEVEKTELQKAQELLKNKQDELVLKYQTQFQTLIETAKNEGILIDFIVESKQVSPELIQLQKTIIIKPL